jgi:hypothetical protein
VKTSRLLRKAISLGLLSNWRAGAHPCASTGKSPVVTLNGSATISLLLLP